MLQQGIELIKKYEGLKLKAYKCPAGIWTIGYGHTGIDVKQGLVITKQKAEQLLIQDLKKFENGVSKLIEGLNINDRQFSALVSFAYNCGLTNLRNSTLLKRLKQKLLNEAANEFLKWNKAAGKQLPGLTKRRNDERKLFLG